MKELIEKYFPDFLQEELVEEIMKEATLKEVEPGTYLLTKGKYIKSIPLIMEGRVKVVREDDEGNEIFLYYLERGNTCATSLTCCTMVEKSRVNAIAETDVTFFAVSIKKLDEWMTKYPSWKNYIMKSYYSRIEELLQTIDGIAFKKMDERLWDYLIKKAELSNSNTFTTTHQEIAYDLNSSREAVSRLLKKLEQIGRIELGRNKITLLEFSPKVM